MHRSLRHSLASVQYQSSLPAAQSKQKLPTAENPGRAKKVTLMLLKKASAKHWPVQSDQCFDTSDSCQASSLADAPTPSLTAESEATLVPQLGSAETKRCAEKSSAAFG